MLVEQDPANKMLLRIRPRPPAGAPPTRPSARPRLVQVPLPSSATRSFECRSTSLSPVPSASATATLVAGVAAQASPVVAPSMRLFWIRAYEFFVERPVAETLAQPAWIRFASTSVPLAPSATPITVWPDPPNIFRLPRMRAQAPSSQRTAATEGVKPLVEPWIRTFESSVQRLATPEPAPIPQ